MKRVLVDVDLSDATLADLRSIAGVEIATVDPDDEAPRPLPAEQLRDVHALCCTYPPTNDADLKALEWVQLASVGFEQLNPLNLPARGVRASNAQGVFDVPIGEWCIAMMVSLARDLPAMFRHQLQETWDRDARFQTEIRGRTVGFWGYGGLARETARLAKAMGLHVHALTRRPVQPRDNVYLVPGAGDPEGLLPDRIFSPSERHDFLAGLDFLVMAMPLTPATRGIVGAAELHALPAHAILLNPARGPLIDEHDLLLALSERWFAGAALDTHHHYPLPSGHPLWSLENVVITPHISGSSLSPRFRDRVGEICRLNLERFVKGEPLLNEIPSDQLAG